MPLPHLAARRFTVGLLALALWFTFALPLASLASSLLPEESRNVSVYRMASPAIVHISVYGRSKGFFFGLLPFEATGSGSIISQEGHILTNAHVVEDAEQIEVTLPNGTVYPAFVSGADKRHDIALLKILPEPGEYLPVIHLGDSENLRVGQKVYAIGNPFGFKSTLTTGVISSLHRRIWGEGGQVMQNVIQTDAAINPGNSGGPLLNNAGQLIGVNTAIYSPSGGSAGIGFAVPSNTAKRIIHDLKKYGRVIRPFLGVRIGLELQPQFARELGLTTYRGLLLKEIKAGSPAAKAGLRGGSLEREITGRRVLAGGDIIVAIDNQPVYSAVRFIDYIESRRPGDTIKVKYIREKKTYTVHITLSEKQ